MHFFHNLWVELIFLSTALNLCLFLDLAIHTFYALTQLILQLFYESQLKGQVDIENEWITWMDLYFFVFFFFGSYVSTNSHMSYIKLTWLDLLKHKTYFNSLTYRMPVAPTFTVMWCVYLFILSASFSVNHMLTLCPKLIHLLIIHSLSMSVSDSASNSPLLHSPSLSQLICCFPCFCFSSSLSKEFLEDKHKIPNCWTASWTSLSLCYADRQADRQSSAAEEWRRW